MKKGILLAAMAVLTLMSCKKDFECRDSDGDVIIECISCNGTEEKAFDLTCAAAGGTVSEK